METSMRNLLAIDPGLRNPAYALFRDGVLVRASRVKIPGTTHSLALGPRMVEVAMLIKQAVGLDAVDDYVTEWPRVYRGIKGKGDPADLFPLAGVGMYLAGHYRVFADAPTAPEWIGNLPKTTTGNPLDSIRGHRIWSRLSDEERSRVTLSHDAVDAVGLGLWKLGRLERRLATFSSP